MKKKILISCTIVAVVGTLVATPRVLSAIKTRQIRAFISHADKIELFFAAQYTVSGTEHPGIVLTEDTDIQAFTKNLKLVPKKPCQCAHKNVIRFWQGDEAMTVSVCNHCFDVIGERAIRSGVHVRRFKMPGVIWNRFQELKRRSATSEAVGCATIPAPPHRTKYERTGHGDLCDLYVEVEGEWVRFYRNVGGSYSVIQSPHGKYLVLTHGKGSLATTVHVFVVPSRQLLNITPWLHSRTAQLTPESTYFTARRFLNPHKVEMGVNIGKRWCEAEPIRGAIEKTHFTINVDDAVEETLYR